MGFTAIPICLCLDGASHEEMQGALISHFTVMVSDSVTQRVPSKRCGLSDLIKR